MAGDHGVRDIIALRFVYDFLFVAVARVVSLHDHLGRLLFARANSAYASSKHTLQDE
jgi:hypothetical protein